MKTITQATFAYRGSKIIARQIRDKSTDKFFCWHGLIDGEEEFPVAARSLQQFEKNFVLQMNDLEAAINIEEGIIRENKQHQDN